jgi:hypothetical protein
MDKWVNEAGRLEVLVLYPDGVALSRAITVLTRIHQKLWPTLHLKAMGVKLEYLEDQMVRTSLDPFVHKADILCFPTKNASTLSEAVKTWLTGMRYSTGRARPLVAVLDFSSDVEEAGRRNTTASFLEEFARMHHMDFLPYSAPAGGSEEMQHVAPEMKQAALSPHWLVPGNESSLTE